MRLRMPPNSKTVIIQSILRIPAAAPGTALKKGDSEIAHCKKMNKMFLH
jgi:hypothetical protein